MEEQNIRKALAIYAAQLAGGLSLKKLNSFEVKLNIFEFLRVCENVES